MNEMLKNITVSTTVTTVSDKTLLRSMNEEYNIDSRAREINLVWRRKRGTNGSQSFLTQQRFSHWGLEIISPGQLDGYVWELRREPEGDGVLASASSLNVPRPSWQGDGVGRVSTGITTNLKDGEIQLRAQIVAATMRRPMLRGSSAEQDYGEYQNNCHKFARSLALVLTDERNEQKQLSEFFAGQSSFGDRHSDPQPAPNGQSTWLTSSAW